MADYVFTTDKPGFDNTIMVSETLIDSSDAEINAALPTAKPGDVIFIASGAKKKCKDLDGSWKNKVGG